MNLLELMKLIKFNKTAFIKISFIQTFREPIVGPHHKSASRAEASRRLVVAVSGVHWHEIHQFASSHWLEIGR